MGHDETPVAPLLVLTAVILVITSVLAGCSDDADRSDQAVSTTQEQAVANQVIATIPLPDRARDDGMLGIAATGIAAWIARGTGRCR